MSLTLTVEYKVLDEDIFVLKESFPLLRPKYEMTLLTDSYHQALMSSLLKPMALSKNSSGGYKTFFVLNSTEHEIYPAHKC